LLAIGRLPSGAGFFAPHREQARSHWTRAVPWERPLVAIAAAAPTGLWWRSHREQARSDVSPGPWRKPAEDLDAGHQPGLPVWAFRRPVVSCAPVPLRRHCVRGALCRGTGL